MDEDSQSQDAKGSDGSFDSAGIFHSHAGVQGLDEQGNRRTSGLSVNTVKHYVSGILEKLQIDKRDKIKDFVNQ